MIGKFVITLGVIVLLIVAGVVAYRVFDVPEESSSRLIIDVENGEVEIFPEARDSGPMNYLVVWRQPEGGEPELLWVLDSDEPAELPRDVHVYSMISWGRIPLYAQQLYPPEGLRPSSAMPGDTLFILFGFWNGAIGNRTPAFSVYQYDIEDRNNASLVRDWPHQFAHLTTAPIPFEEIPEPVRQSIKDVIAEARGHSQ